MYQVATTMRDEPICEFATANEISRELNSAIARLETHERDAAEERGYIERLKKAHIEASFNELASGQKGENHA